ncbi:MAG TPA: isopentenyl-diphosphate Delta-isomerase, partial [Salmonella bongori]|nr:isopentenyl-diphosphate Delta-isomerase [Salmonella bongori]
FTRRCHFELSVEITDIISVYPHFRYRATDPNGIVENEVCPVFAARATSVLQVNRKEVMDYQWSELKSVWKSLLATPWAFSPWMVMQSSDEKARELLHAYCQH